MACWRNSRSQLIVGGLFGLFQPRAQFRAGSGQTGDFARLQVQFLAARFQLRFVPGQRRQPRFGHGAAVAFGAQIGLQTRKRRGTGFQPLAQLGGLLIPDDQPLLDGGNFSGQFASPLLVGDLRSQPHGEIPSARAYPKSSKEDESQTKLFHSTFATAIVRNL